MSTTATIYDLLITNSSLGKSVVVPREIFAAFEYFIKDPKPSGSITIHFKGGGVAGVETNTRTILK